MTTPATPAPAVIFLSAEVYQQVLEATMWLEATPKRLISGLAANAVMDEIDAYICDPVNEVLTAQGLCPDVECLSVETEGVSRLIAILSNSDGDEFRVQLGIQG